MVNWHGVPFLRLLVPLILGILFALYLGFPLPFGSYLFLPLMLFLAWLSFQKISFKLRSLYGVLISIFLFLIGHQITYHKNHLNKENHFRQYISEDNTLTGIIREIKSKNGKIKITLSVTEVRVGDDRFTCTGNLLCHLPFDSKSMELEYGDLVSIYGRPYPVPKLKNPKAFDYHSYLKNKNIHDQIFLKENAWKYLGSGYGNYFLALAKSTQTRFVSVLKRNISTENELAVASALLLGYKGEMNTTVQSAYANTGAMHVLAVSGLHVGIIYPIILWLFSFLKVQNKTIQVLKSFLPLLAIWIFAFITGASASVLRASTMFSFLHLGILLNRHSNVYNTLAAAAFILLLVNPYFIVDVGFQLSFLALLGIVYFQPLLYPLWYIEHKFGQQLWMYISVALAAQMTTFPISIYYFHQFPVYFWLSGIIVVPFATLILGLGLLLFFIDTLFPFLSYFIGSILTGLIWIMNALVFLIQQIPGSLLQNIWISSLVMFLLYGVVAGIVYLIQSRNSKWIFVPLIFLFLISVNFVLKNFRDQTNSEIVLYHSRESMIDFFDGKKVTSLYASENTKDQIYFTAENYRHFKGIQDQTSLLLSDSLHSQTLLYKYGFIQFYTTKIKILDDNENLSNAHKITVDYLILSNNTKVKIETLSDFFDYKMLVFDASNPAYAIKKWKETCIAKNLPFYNISENGALIIDAKK